MKTTVIFVSVILVVAFMGPVSAQNVNLHYSTFLAGWSLTERGRGIAVDSNLCAYVTGQTTSTAFPTVNPYQPGFTGGSVNDVFVTKFSSTGSALVYSTFLGGGGEDGGNAISVDTLGSAYVTGWTASTADFPVIDAYQSSSNEESGEYDAFVTKFSPSGSSLVFSTYLGGRYDDSAINGGIAVGSDNSVYVTGTTISDNFPTRNPYQASWNEGYSGPPYNFYTWDVFVTRLASTGMSLIFSTYFGGDNWDAPAAIAVDDLGNAYIAGWTESTNDFPITGAYQSTAPNDTETGFVSKFSAGGQSLSYSTYLGGDTSERCYGIDVDSFGSAYVGGTTSSTNFPVVNPYQSSLISSYTDGFITKLSPTGASLTYSTYLGGNNGVNMQGGSCRVSSSLQAYIVGSTSSTDFPAVNAYQATLAGYNDVFVTSLGSTGSSLVYSTYLGGAANSDYGWGIAVADDESAYVTGYTKSTDFPTVNPYQPTKNGSGAYNDIFVSKLAFGEPVSSSPPWIYDYNGDGTSDIAVFRASSGLWAIRGISRAYFGSFGDLPVPGDYNGDGTTEIGIYRSSSGLWAIRGMTRSYFGSSSDQPFSRDYNGDGSCDIGIFRESSGLWAVRGITRLYFGGSSDEPVPGYYDGDSTADIGIFRESSGLWAVSGLTRIYFGSSGDQTVPGDYDGDGAWDIAVFRDSSGLWAVRGITRAYFGSTGDDPLPADYSGSGLDGIGIFRESSGLWAVRGVTRVYYGSPGDIPVTR